MRRNEKVAALVSDARDNKWDEFSKAGNGVDPSNTVDQPKDYFVEKDGLRFAGIHLLIDLVGAINLDNKSLIEQSLHDAARAAGATPLHSHLHRFSENGGVSGVLVLAESHISIHTWPERSFAAIDLFTCGQCDPYAAIEVLRETFQPSSIQVNEQKRGLLF
jgi:S-adenosylmethionine decarboxylase